MSTINNTNELPEDFDSTQSVMSKDSIENIEHPPKRVLHESVVESSDFHQVYRFENFISWKRTIGLYFLFFLGLREYIFNWTIFIGVVKTFDYFWILYRKLFK